MKRVLFAGACAILVLAVGGCGSSSPAIHPASNRSAADVALPTAAGHFDYQLGGAYPPPSGVVTVVRDRTATPAKGLYNVCYVNAFQSQAEESDWWVAHHPTLLLSDAGRHVGDPDWPGEILFDTSSSAKRKQLADVIGGWIDGCAAKGFTAVEPDNLDSWTRSHERLTQADNVAFARLLTSRAHARHLAIAQKNAADLAASGRGIGFDFAVAEECQAYSECGSYIAAYGAHVLEVEYTDNGVAAFRASCSSRRGKLSIILRDRDLVSAGASGYSYSAC